MLGIYEISIRKISFDTGLNKDDVTKILDKLKDDKKIFFKENHVILVNFLKNQSYNPNMKKSAINSYNELPTKIKPSPNMLDTNDLAKGWVSLYKELGKAYATVPNIEVEVEGEIEIEIEEEEKEIFPFKTFWEDYHRLSQKTKSDRAAAEKYWNRLSQKEKGLAIKNIEPYVKSIDNLKYVKKARTYLADKNFNDEFEVKQKFVYTA